MADFILDFDDNRMLMAFRLALPAWRNKEMKLYGAIPPEEYLIKSLPEGTPALLQAQLLFAYIRLNLAYERAWTLVNQCARVFVETPWLIDPLLEPQRKYDLFYQQEDHFKEIIRTSGMRPDLFGWWINGLKMLREDGLQGDPRNIFYQSDGTREGMIKAFTRFDGIAQKVAQLEINAFHGWSLANDSRLKEWFENVAEPFIAVDIWWMRLFRQWGLVTRWSSDHHTRISRVISDYVCAFCKKHKIDYLEISQAIWHIGSRICGQYRPKSNNSKSADWCLQNCPMNSLCTCLVRPTPEEEAVGSQGWNSALERCQILDKQQLVLLEKVKVPSTNQSVPGIEALASKARLSQAKKQNKNYQLDLEL